MTKIEAGNPVDTYIRQFPADVQVILQENRQLIELPPCTMMVFQGEPYDDNDFMAAIQEVWQHVKGFDPQIYGYQWAAESAPRFQLVPMGYRGYIEAYPVKKLNQK